MAAQACSAKVASSSGTSTASTARRRLATSSSRTSRISGASERAPTARHTRSAAAGRPALRLVISEAKVKFMCATCATSSRYVAERRSSTTPPVGDGLTPTRATHRGPGVDRSGAGGVLAWVEPHGDSGDTRPLRPGEEMVLAGAKTRPDMEVTGERYHLDATTSLNYPTDRPHEWRNPRNRGGPARSGSPLHG